MSVNGSDAFAVESFPESVASPDRSFGLDIIHAPIDDAPHARLEAARKMSAISSAERVERWRGGFCIGREVSHALARAFNKEVYWPRKGFP